MVGLFPTAWSIEFWIQRRVKPKYFTVIVSPLSTTSLPSAMEETGGVSSPNCYVFLLQIQRGDGQSWSAKRNYEDLSRLHQSLVFRARRLYSSFSQKVSVSAPLMLPPLKLLQHSRDGGARALQTYICYMCQSADLVSFYLSRVHSISC